MVVLILLAILVAILVSLVLYARWNYGTLESLGTPVIEPHFLLGSTYNTHNEVVAEVDILRFQKYGPVYGVYEGRAPQVHICDPDIIRAIFVKDSDSFNERRIMDFKSPLLNEMPDFLPYTKWKFVRSMTTPTLTSAKIKAMSHAMKEGLFDFTTDLKTKVKENGGRPVKMDVRDAIFTMLTDVIMRCVFSIKIDRQHDPNNFFVNIIKRLMLGDPDTVNPPGIFYTISLSFPFLKRLLPPLFNVKAAEDFAQTYRKILEGRRKSGRKEKDYTETVLTWMDKLETPEFKAAGITELTIMMQALIIFFAGQDQISNIVTTTFLKAAQQPEVEEKILKELDTFLTKHNGKIEHENLSELVYLNACMLESLRFYPVFIRTDRVCTKDWEYKNFRIKKGMLALLPIWAINRNPEFFPDPEKYDPERFMPENKAKLHPYAFSSFGHGPRNCIGMRFASDLMLLIAAHVYKDFKFKAKKDDRFKFIPGNLFIAIFEPLEFHLVQREESKN